MTRSERKGPPALPKPVEEMTDEEFNAAADEWRAWLDTMPRPKPTREDAPMDGVVVEKPKLKATRNRNA
jgi:hypothetical protein